MTLTSSQSAALPNAGAGLPGQRSRPARLWISFAALLILSPAAAQPPPFPGGMPTPPPGAAAREGEEAKRRRPREPLEAGSTEAFSYRPHPELPGVFIVDMSDGSSIPVGEGYLASIVRGPHSMERKSEAVRSYPKLSDQIVGKLLEMHYPDPADVPAAPLGERTLQGDNGETLILTDDPLAKGYVRASRVGADGEVLEEFTVSRLLAESALGKAYASDKQKIDELVKFHAFRLPEDLRPRANDLSTTDLRKLVEDLPALQSQQTFRAARAIAVMREKTGDRFGAESTASERLAPGSAAGAANRFPAATGGPSSRRSGESSDAAAGSQRPAGTDAAGEPRRNAVGLAAVTVACIAAAFGLWLFLNRRKQG